jgi:hypothetical protein
MLWKCSLFIVVARTACPGLRVLEVEVGGLNLDLCDEARDSRISGAAVAPHFQSAHEV